MFQNLPRVTKSLLIVNVTIWLAALVMHYAQHNELIMNLFALHFPTGSPESNFHFWQPFTYMFLHDNAGFVHILFNMYTLAIFGSVLERVWGGTKFLIFYFVCGLGAAACHLGVEWAQFAHLCNHYTPDSVIAAFDVRSCVGASGAIYGLLLAYGMLFPDSRLMLIFPPIAMKAKWFVIIFAGIELVLGVAGGGGVAHFAHLGGMLFGLILILIWKKKQKLYEYHD